MGFLGRLLLIAVVLCKTSADDSDDCFNKETFKLIFPSNVYKPYVKLPTLPADLTELSLCFWIRTTNETSRTVFSYALPKRDNEIMAAVSTSTDGTGFVTFHRQTQNANQIQGSIIKDITKEEDKFLHNYKTSFKGVWQHVCITWLAWSGKCQIFINGQFSAKKEKVAINRPIETGGIIVLGQDQDVYGGAFEEVDGLRAEISELHLWDRELDEGQVNQVANCRFNEEGNIVNWSKLKMQMFNGVQMAPLRLPRKVKESKKTRN